MRLLAAFLVPVAVFAADPAAALEHARQVNAELAAQLPNFVVDETVMRYKSRHTDPRKWEVFDKIEAEVVVRASSFGRQMSAGTASFGRNPTTTISTGGSRLDTN